MFSSQCFYFIECRQMSAQNVLLKELLDGYGFQSTRPVYNLSHVTTVVFGLTLIQVIELVNAFLNYTMHDMGQRLSPDFPIF